MIYIKKTNKCDTRTLKKGQTLNIKDVEEDTKKHREAVYDACQMLATKLEIQAMRHDYTKCDDFLPMFKRALETGFKDDEFKKLNWWQIHKTTERHHLNDFVPENVNLIDVIEMLCDCVCAGKARTGKVFKIELSNELLQQAVENTVEYLIDNIKVEENE